MMFRLQKYMKKNDIFLLSTLSGIYLLQAFSAFQSTSSRNLHLSDRWPNTCTKNTKLYEDNKNDVFGANELTNHTISESVRGGESSHSNSFSNLLNKSPNSLVTVSDIDKIMSRNRAADKFSGNIFNSLRNQPFDAIEYTKDTVAFPQPSVLIAVDIQRGTSIAGSLIGLVIGTTILPNLWLIGAIFGAVYGYDITKEIPSDGLSIFPSFLVSFGKKIANLLLQLNDYCKSIWFLYKTGQLSYEYYKTYENLDSKFAIQTKVDAWNMMFAEGKKKFDVWEQDNEIGRKVLAGLRTAWLVDEQSRMRTNGRSRYRLVQIAYDGKNCIGQFLQKSFSWCKSWFLPGTAKKFLKGLQSVVKDEGSIIARLGSVAVILITVNICGAIFSISSSFCMIMCSIVAFVWPSWASDLISRLNEVGTEIQLKGQRRNNRKPSRTSSFDLFAYIQEQCEKQNNRPNGNKRNYSSYKKRGRTSKIKRKSSRLSSSPFFGSIRRSKKRR